MPEQDDMSEYEGIRPPTAEELAALLGEEHAGQEGPSTKMCLTSFRAIILPDGGMAAELDPESLWSQMRPATLNDIGPACWAIMTEVTAQRAAIHTMGAMQAQMNAAMAAQQADQLLSKLDIPGMGGMNRQQRRHPGAS